MTVHSLHWSPIGAATPLSRRCGRHATAFLPILLGDERVLYRSQRPEGTAAVATDAALHYRTPASAWARIHWVDVAAVGWSRRANRMRLQCRTGDGCAFVIELAADPALAALATERVAYVHVLQRRVELTPGVFGLVELVRAPDGAAPRWRIQPEDHVDLDDPAIQRACARVISELRALTGC